jgi:hypothetical protein
MEKATNNGPVQQPSTVRYLTKVLATCEARKLPVKKQIEKTGPGNVIKRDQGPEPVP